MDYIQNLYGYSDYQMAQLKFSFLTIASELSKTIIMGILFKRHILLFLYCLIVFQLIRSSTGGLHCKRYISCLVVSCIFMSLCIYVLPLIPLHNCTQLSLLLACTIITYIIGPLTSKLHIELDSKAIHNNRKRGAFIILLYSICVFVFANNTYITCGFWIIVLNTLQLIISKIAKEVSKNA